MRPVRIWEKEGSLAGNHSKARTSGTKSMSSHIRGKTPDETAKQERCARRDAWESAKNVHKLKKESKDRFYSLAEVWVMPAFSTMKPEE